MLAFVWFAAYLVFLAFLKSIGVPIWFLVFIAIWVALADVRSSAVIGPRYRAPKPAPRTWRRAWREDWKLMSVIFGGMAVISASVALRVGFWTTLGIGFLVGGVPAAGARLYEGTSRTFAVIASGLCGVWAVLVVYGVRLVTSSLK